MNKTIVKTKVITKKTPNKVVTFRFTLNPRMQDILAKLEKRYSMLDKTEIVKVALSKLVLDEKIDDDDGVDLMNNFENNINKEAFETDKEFYTWWNKNKNDLRK
jgi:hypothetical protein